MVKTELNKYLDSLPTSMSLKKKLIKVIMKSSKPLTQKEIKELTETNDWTNVKRILDELLNNGLIMKKTIGKKDYYLKIDLHRFNENLIDNNITYFMDIFESDTLNENEKYIRIKQVTLIDKDRYETLGKITISLEKVEELCSKLISLKGKTIKS